MYLSHPVRRIREDPQSDEEVGLVVELADAAGDGALDALRDAVVDAGGRVGRDLGFGAHHVVVPEPAVEALCALDDVVRIETDATISLDVETPDAEPETEETSVDDLREHLDRDDDAA